MRTFEYYAPGSVDDACEMLSRLGATSRILAGGTDVLIELRKNEEASPAAIIDVSRIASLKGIELSRDAIIIKPLTTHMEILHSQILSVHAPLLQAAARSIGSPQIRNRGTVGGNIMNAAACADTVPPLIALDAVISLRSLRGERSVKLADFFTKPYVTIAERDEILVSIRFPKLPAGARTSFVKLGRRNALSISRLSVAAVLVKDQGGKITEARIVPGAAFPKWQRVPSAEAVLLGQAPSKELFLEAGKKVSAAMISFTGRRWSTEYKEPVIAVLVQRALEACR